MILSVGLETPPELLELAEKLRQTVESTRLPHGEKQPLGCVTISGGVAEFPRDGMSVGELIKHADEALYKAKKGGRNRVLAYKGVDIGDFSEEVLPVADGAPDAGMALDR